MWCLLDYSKERKYTVVGFCSGTIAGLVAATPSSGFVPAWAALIIGIVSGAVCNYATKRELSVPNGLASLLMEGSLRDCFHLSSQILRQSGRFPRHVC